MNQFLRHFTLLMFGLCLAEGRSFHVAPDGADDAAGTGADPLKTIQAAADLAQPGDEIVVHAGVYRERIDPPRGGLSDKQRITYRAAPGEKVFVKGSEVVSGWSHLQDDTWVVNVPNGLFGDFNPFADVISGDWFRPWDRSHTTGAVYLDGHWLTPAAEKEEVLQPVSETPLWFAEVGKDTTTVWAQFKDVDPNQHLVEVNARQSVFYPSKPGMDYITVKGFVLEQAATPWAPPTAEQIGLIGTHWSKGWRIEDNTIRYSTCVGVTLGKYGDEWDNRAGTAEGYNGTIRRALENGWSKENIGSHLVGGNHISHCEQAGIVGSLGAIFSTIRGNHIHGIYMRRLFGGAEMSAIKIHASIDMLIEGNCIHDNNRGIWLDWMAQGVRVTRNLIFNHDQYDLFMEVNHGPYLVDNNVFLSDDFLWDMSTGGTFAHNLALGSLKIEPQERETPYHKPHSTEVADLHNIPGGDNRWFNNLLGEKTDLTDYAAYADSMTLEGNAPLGFTPEVVNDKDGFHLLWNNSVKREPLQLRLVTTERMGETRISKLPFVQRDGSPYRLDRDYFGKPRRNLEPGPFAVPPEDGALQLWNRRLKSF